MDYTHVYTHVFVFKTSASTGYKIAKSNEVDTSAPTPNALSISLTMLKDGTLTYLY